MSATIWLLAQNLAFSLVLALCYFGLLALIIRNLKYLDPKQAALCLSASLPMRLSLLGLGMAWLLRNHGLMGAISLVLGLWAGRFIVRRWVQLWKG